ncbi:MAG: glycosyltransferase family 4 protein [Burkholderiales bacterium]
MKPASESMPPTYSHHRNDMTVCGSPVDLRTPSGDLAGGVLPVPGRTAAAREKLLIVSARWSHLGGHSGLAPLAEALATHFDVERVQPSTMDKLRVFFSRAFRYAGEKVLGKARSSSWNPFYNRVGLLLETAAKRTLKSGQYDVVLFEAFEDHFNAFRHSAGWIGRTRIAAVSHQPPAWWRLYGTSSEVFDRVDTLFVLSTAAERYMKTELGRGNVHFIPHGVDTEFFIPSEGEQAGGAVNIVFAGLWLRDFRLLKDTIGRLSDLASRVTFHLVVPEFARTQDAHYALAVFDNVRWYSGLSDTALRDLYQRADLMFLPLIDSTANNSLLEAMAVGLPLVVSDVGGVRDYLDDDGAVFVSPNTAASAAERIRWAIANPEDCRKRAAHARRKAVETLTWERFAVEAAAVIEQAGKGRRA